ncbi:hypothetical protein ASE98_08420 [Pseudomonas sp. Leaf48]|uniref:hypothetical protein n=1 Tax=Pseudomonas sp. Leaf48 TaxID=1736221 RepID=UPI0007299FD8|nr:hypothetical protein [Pseudomonas sp. Leaf48]KQN44957.1 hypothetical protein ASE98_08420 [Pseudomonas sp. Leaf48]
MSNTAPTGMVMSHNLISCIGELSLHDFDNLTDCTQLATTSADLAHNRYAATNDWLDEYVRTFWHLGWSLHEGAITTRTRSIITGSIAEFLVQSAQSMSDPRQGNAMIDTLDALKQDKPAVNSLDEESLKGRRFQVAPARYDSKGDLHMAVFNLELSSHTERSNFLFWAWEKQSAELIQQWAFLKLDRNKLESKRQSMEAKLRKQVTQRFALRKRQQ